MKRKWEVFWAGSRTYFWSSLFFPSRVRSDVAVLYAFVRLADDFVDQVPPDEEGLDAFESLYRRALREEVGDVVVDEFVCLLRRKKFCEEWVDAFFSSMRSDLGVVDYTDVDSLLGYTYGSAEVIGLMMARIMDLPAEADEAARMLGRSMQMINFVRDIDEDTSLGRVYIPASLRESLPDLSLASAREHPEEFVACMHAAIDLYDEWLAQAKQGFSFIPRRCLVPIRTATSMYSWTARRIREDPFVVFSGKLKPSKLRVFVRGLRFVFS